MLNRKTEEIKEILSPSKCDAKGILGEGFSFHDGNIFREIRASKKAAYAVF